MSYYPTQTYGSYQTPYSGYTGQTHYSPQYPSQVPPSNIPLYSSPLNKSESPPPEPLAAPTLSAIIPETASNCLQKLLFSELRHAGFDSADPSAIYRLEMEVVALIDKLFGFAHDYANHANRANPLPSDMLLACKQHGMDKDDFDHTVRVSRKRKRDRQEFSPPTIIPPHSRSPSPELLGSDDEDMPPMVPLTLRSLPHPIPKLPPKHTYLRTPASPPKKAALPSLEKKLKNAGLVQESLKNLLLATEETTGQEDGEILGAIVNWETTIHPRKRWRLSSQ